MDGYRYPEHIRDGILRFNYPNGVMAIMLASFFPSDAARLRKLMKAIGLISDYGERKQTARELLSYLEERYDPKETEAALREHANAVVDARTKAKEMDGPILRQAETVRRTDSHLKSLPSRSRERATWKEKLKQEKDKLRAMKEEQRGCKSDAAYNNGRFIEVRAEGKRYEKNLEILREFLADRSRL